MAFFGFWTMVVLVVGYHLTPTLHAMNQQKYVMRYTNPALYEQKEQEFYTLLGKVGRGEGDFEQLYQSPFYPHTPRCKAAYANLLILGDAQSISKTKLHMDGCGGYDPCLKRDLLRQMVYEVKLAMD